MPSEDGRECINDIDLSLPGCRRRQVHTSVNVVEKLKMNVSRAGSAKPGMSERAKVVAPPKLLMDWAVSASLLFKISRDSVNIRQFDPRCDSDTFDLPSSDVTSSHRD